MAKLVGLRKQKILRSYVWCEMLSPSCEAEELRKQGTTYLYGGIAHTIIALPPALLFP